MCDCTPPFSFYFDLIARRYGEGDGPLLPLHRICTLARKQHANRLIVEDALAIDGVEDEIAQLSRACGGGGRGEAIAVSFLRDSVAGNAPRLLGQAIVVNFVPDDAKKLDPIVYVYEAVMSVPSLAAEGDAEGHLLNNFSPEGRSFERIVDGESYEVTGFYYCQQNRRTHVCAHAALRMALSVMGERDLSARTINDQLGIETPCAGLSLHQLREVIEGRGLHAQITPCKGLSAEEYLSVLASIVQSAEPALLVFTTGHPLVGEAPPDEDAEESVQHEEHVVLVFGHTMHSDEWHPQAIPAYAGPKAAQYYPASGWIDHYLIHDDNFGPYFTLSSRAFEFHQSVKADYIIALRTHPVEIPAHLSEALASIHLTNLMQGLRGRDGGRWFKYLTSRDWRYILRSVMISRKEYIEHLQSSRDHDGRRLGDKEIARLNGLPERFWMVEFTLPGIFTGNHSKVGEVLVKLDLDDSSLDANHVIAIRLPEVIAFNDDERGFRTETSGLSSHSPVMRKGLHGQLW